MTVSLVNRRPIRTLAAAAASAHAADQLALAALPLCATLLLSSSPGEVSRLVAMQSAAWLLMSLPAGAITDRWGHLAAMRRGQMLAIAGSTFIVAALLGGSETLVAIGAFVAAIGSVSFLLASGAIVPSVVPSSALPRANARIEFFRGIAALAAPILAGQLSTRASPIWGYVLAAICSLLALATLRRLDQLVTPPAPSSALALHDAVRDGARFVLATPLLRAIALCAIAWNFAFMGLLAIFVPLALRHLALGADEAGIALSAFGAGSIAAALVAGRLLDRVAPRVILVGGPACSVVAAGWLWAAPAGSGLAAPIATFVLLGFAPMLWSIGQNAVRQALTPPALLGRVGATIQMASYGARLLGALAAGALATAFGFSAALALILAGFTTSTLVAITTPLARLRALPKRQEATSG